LFSVSASIPDPYEPKFLKENADETIDGYYDAAVQFIQDSIIAVESMFKSLTDVYEEEGAMHVTGTVLPALIPTAWAAKEAKGLAGLRGGGKPKVNSPKKNIVNRRKLSGW